MNRTKRLLVIIASILAASLVGASLMMRVDLGGTRWLKFILYLVIFASISASALFSSHYSCSGVLGWLRRRS